MRRSRWLLLALLAVVVLAGVVALQPAPPPRNPIQIAYSELLDEVAQGNVRAITLTGRTALVVLATGPRVTAYLPVEPNRLVERAIAAGAHVVARPVEEDVNPLLHYILAWLPSLAFVLAFRYWGIRIVRDRPATATRQLAELHARLARLEQASATSPAGSSCRP